MISVLIPTYNYNIFPLAKEMQKQLEKSGVPYEIRIYDDASTQNFENDPLIQDLNHVIYKKMPENKGRLALRYQLATDAEFDLLLFMDADTFPQDRFFVSKLLKTIEKESADVYFGGLKVPSNPPTPDRILRWKYGKERESKPLDSRRKDPYKSILCGCLTLKKSVFLNEAAEMLAIKKYGLDVLFSYQLKKNKRKILHFHNPVTHLGFETNPVFLTKTEEALETFKYLIDQSLLPQDYIKLTHYAYQFKKILPKSIWALMYKVSRSILQKNLDAGKPSLKLFDIYKLLYFNQLN